jgi:hypothetical protein
LLLLVPFFFHLLSVYRGEIQIFPLSAFGLLNVRYGLIHLVAAAMFAPAAIGLLLRLGPRKATITFAVAVVLQYALILDEGPSQIAIFQEGFRNGVNSRAAREREQIASALKANPPGGVVLMQTGSLGPVVSKGGLRFADVIHEGTIRWHEVESRIPDDVLTIILEEDDQIHQKLRQNELLSDDFDQNFRLRARVGKIEVYERKQK